jgi:trimeric autotransporter adhesin
MKIKQTLILIAGVVFCTFAARLTRAQCPETCDSNSNTALGDFASVGISQNVAIGEYALELGGGSSCVAVGRAALANSGNGSFQTGVGAGAVQFNTGSNNTGVGYETLYGVGGSSTGSNNAATGYEVLHSNTTGGSNTASGYEALFFNTSGSFNTATGRGALFHNTTANNNVATGYQTLNSNKTGTANTATGTQALQANTASDNTANGYQALNKNTSGPGNTAIGYQALFSNTTNGSNTATGYQCLFNSTGNADTGYGQAALYNNTTGGTNTAVGSAALYENTIGSNNIAIGSGAGFSLSTGSDNIDVGNVGAAGESSTVRIGTTGTQTNTYIAGINGVTVAGGIGVIVDSSGHLGTSTSSARFKEKIQPMDKASEAILSLEPVTFRYKHELDPKGIPQFGLVAEQVEKVNPNLVARDDRGKAYSVRYEAVNAMLLNEFLKERKRNEKQEATIAEQEKQIQALTASFKEQSTEIKKVNARLAGIHPDARLVTNE